MPTVDKLIVTNTTALRAKYGPAGVAAILQNVDALIKSDERRKLTTRLLDVSSPGAMRALDGRPVVESGNPRQNKEAVDAAYRALSPDYIMILGSIDVIPHQDLKNPLYRPNAEYDDDRYAWGDLPYACDAPYSQRIEDFRGPTRVVGRLPDLTGADVPTVVLHLLRTAAQYRPRAPEAYRRYFGLSAKIWRWSSHKTLLELVGDAGTLFLSPPEDENWTDHELAPLLHFINCHGDKRKPQFWGQATSESRLVVSCESRRLAGRVRDGAVVAVECCYGAELYRSGDDPSRRAICYTYLTDGAYGYFGSSTISYGPSRGNARADLICRYFLERVLAGASLGRAALQARQRFVLDTPLLHPSELKTLAQFNLLGDPSIHPVAHTPQGLERTPLFREVTGLAGVLPPGRKARRDQLMRTGASLVETVGAMRPSTTLRPKPAVRQALTRAARASGFTPRPDGFMSFTIHDPAGRRLDRRMRTRRTRPTAVYSVMGALPRRDGGPRRIVLISATVQEGRIVMLRRLHSR
jgi:hypothetical protein